MKKKLLFLIIFISISLLFCFYLFKHQTTTQAITVDNPQELHVYTTNKNDKTATYISPGTYTLTSYNSLWIQLNPYTIKSQLKIYTSDNNYSTQENSPETTIDILEDSYSKNPETFYYKELISKMPSTMTTEELENRNYELSFQTEFTIKKNQYLYIYSIPQPNYDVLYSYTLEKTSIY